MARGLEALGFDVAVDLLGERQRGCLVAVRTSEGWSKGKWKVCGTVAVRILQLWLSLGEVAVLRGSEQT